ncbi:hypothetical protein [Candidatus Poriferisocius sp.]|uniref:hypothetical protein n=1 Tax=Candidatus Poriferisocius sp. TaxID=3101276 RepID=UPI003B0263DF
MRNEEQGLSSAEKPEPVKLTFKQFCSCAWIAIKQVKPIFLPVYVTLTIYASFGGWPFPEGRYVSIVGALVLVVNYTIVEIKLKDAYQKARQQYGSLNN